MIQSKKVKGRNIRLKVKNKQLIHFCDKCKNQDQTKFSKDSQILTPEQTEFIVDLVCRECGAREPIESLPIQCLEIEEQIVKLTENEKI